MVNESIEELIRSIMCSAFNIDRSRIRFLVFDSGKCVFDIDRDFDYAEYVAGVVRGELYRQEVIKDFEVFGRYRILFPIGNIWV